MSRTADQQNEKNQVSKDGVEQRSSGWQGGKTVARKEAKGDFLLWVLEKRACYIVESQQVALVWYLSYTSIKYLDKGKKTTGHFSLIFLIYKIRLVF